MLENWNPEAYRCRAREWQARAAERPPGDDRNACEVLAEGYAHLAQLIEEAQASLILTSANSR